MAKKQSSAGRLEDIIAKELPNMRVVKRRPPAKLAKADAQRSDAPPTTTGFAAMADAGDEDDDDVTIVNVEPKSGRGADASSLRDQVVLVSKKRKKIIAMRG